MCRLLAYKDPPVILDHLFYEPEHSIIFPVMPGSLICLTAWMRLKQPSVI